MAPFGWIVDVRITKQYSSADLLSLPAEPTPDEQPANNNKNSINKEKQIDLVLGCSSGVGGKMRAPKLFRSKLKSRLNSLYHMRNFT